MLEDNRVLEDDCQCLGPHVAVNGGIHVQVRFRIHSYLDTTDLPLMDFRSSRQNQEQPAQFESPVHYGWSCINTGHESLPQKLIVGRRSLFMPA